MYYTMATIFSLFSFLVLILLIFQNQISSKLKSLMMSSTYVIIITVHVKWACEFLFRSSFFYRRMDISVPASAELCQKLRVEQLPVRRQCSGGAAVECAVCLNTIEEGEEMRELRCDHLFHRGCLDRWVGYKHVTCPLCRLPLLDSSSSTTTTTSSMEFGTHHQLVVFENFAAFTSTSTERDTWWLR